MATIQLELAGCGTDVEGWCEIVDVEGFHCQVQEDQLPCINRLTALFLLFGLFNKKHSLKINNCDSQYLL